MTASHSISSLHTDPRSTSSPRNSRMFPDKKTSSNCDMKNLLPVEDKICCKMRKVSLKKKKFKYKNVELIDIKPLIFRINLLIDKFN